MRYMLLLLLHIILLSCRKKEIILTKQEVLYKYNYSDKNYSVEILFTLLSDSNNDIFYITEGQDTLFLSINNIRDKEIDLHIILPNRELKYNDSIFIQKMKNIEIKAINNNIKIKRKKNIIETRMYMWEAGTFGGIE